jgi:sulfoxide reductase heme-binding subunit YedZ
MHLRRSIGVVTFLFVLAHILVWAVLDVQTLNAIWADLSERPYIMVGFAGFVLMVPLAISSNNLSVRKLGPLRWRRLHMLVYPAAILGAVHYVWLARGFQIEPLIYLVLITGLVALRGAASRIPTRNGTPTTGEIR